MKNNKTPGIDYITKEILKEGGEEILQNLKTLFNKCLDAEKVASDWKEAITVLLYKNGDKQGLNNYRSITLLSQTYKILSIILARSLTNKIEMFLTHEQAGFRRNYSTIDHLLIVKVLIEKANEYHLPEYVALMDYEKAFDSTEIWATREILWNSRVNCRYVDLIDYIYEETQTSFQLQQQT